jgi:hypothetical protein
MTLGLIFGGLLFGGLGLLALLFLGLLGLAAFIFWIWMLIDCIQNNSIGSTEKIIWALVILFLHCLGALIYFFAGRNKRSS